jgi:Uncharacterized protein conserved in bacteria
MKLQVNDLYQYQEELDARIFLLHEVTRESTRRDRILALLVELSEMANETRCFKYWSLQNPSEKEVILEEYGDGIHFLLSLGIDLVDSHDYFETNDMIVANVSEAILFTFNKVNQLQEEFTLSNYETAFTAYLNVAKLLGFTAEEIRSYYLLKNKKNHERQDTNY